MSEIAKRNREIERLGKRLVTVTLFGHEIAYFKGQYHIVTPFGTEETRDTPVQVCVMLNDYSDDTLDRVSRVRSQSEIQSDEAVRLGEVLYSLRKGTPVENKISFAQAVMLKAISPAIDKALDNLTADDLHEYFDEDTLVSALRKYGWMVSDDAKVAMKFDAKPEAAAVSNG